MKAFFLLALTLVRASFHLYMVAIFSLFVEATTSAEGRASIILVPGAFHPPIVFNKTVELLTEAKYEHVFAISLPSVGNLVGRDADIEAVRSILTKEIEGGRDVLLVGNSYGGTVIGEAVKGLKGDSAQSTPSSQETTWPSIHSFFTPTSRSAPRGKILGLVFFAGYIPYITEVTHPASKPDILKISPPIFHFGVEGKVTSDGDPKIPPEVAFYNDLSKDEAKYWASKLQFSSYAALNATATYIPYTGDFKCTYVIGAKDNSIPPAFAETFITQVGAKFNIEHIDAGHVPFLSIPDEVSSLIRKASGEMGIAHV